MNRFLVIACIGLVTACGEAPGSGGTVPQSAASAQAVAADSGDFPGLMKCPESGTWELYLAAEQKADSASYDSDKKDWDKLKAAGADDGYVAVYGEKASDCGQFNGEGSVGRSATVYVVRFKDEGSAASNFKTNAKNYKLSDSDLDNVRSTGGTVTQGSASGLGDNSVTVSVVFLGVQAYVAFWQNKRFEIAVILFGLRTSEGQSATQKIDGRVR